MDDNAKGEFIYRMLGSIISSFCREFGVKNMYIFIEYLAGDEEFWDIQKRIAELDKSAKPFERGAHDFIEKDNPSPGKTYLVFLEKVILDANKYLEESKKHHSQIDADLARRDEKKAFTLIKECAETILKNRPQEKE